MKRTLWGVVHRAAGIWARHRRRLFGLALLLITVAIGVQYVVQTGHERAVSQCQARYNDAAAKVLNLRGELADADRLANHDLIEAVVAAHRTSDVRRAELRWLATQRRLDARRRANPYPRLPSRACRWI